MTFALQPGQPVSVTVLNGAEECAGKGRILEIPGRHARLGSSISLQMGQAVQVEGAGHVVLGEVVAILKTAPEHMVTIEIRHTFVEPANGEAP